jgi:hypothetical protein
MTEEQEKQGTAGQGQEADKQAPTQPAGGEQEGGTTPGAQPETDAEDQEDGRIPPPDDLSKDPAYEPEDEALKDIKGG